MEINKRNVLRGITWSAADKWGTQLLSFLVILILARLLSPEAFGLVAMASAVISFFNMWVDQGLTKAIIQVDELTESHLNTAFWANMIFGVVFGSIGWLGAGAIASFYQESALQNVISWLSLGLVLTGLSQVQIAILRRELDFKSLAMRSVIAKVVAGVAGIAGALGGLGVYSLVLQLLIQQGVSALVLWIKSDWKPRFEFSGISFRELFSYSIKVTFGELIYFASSRMGDLIIAYFLGTKELGYFNIGYNVVQRLSSLIDGTLKQVTFSVFSRLQNDLPRLRKAIRQILEYLSFIVLPIFSGVAFLAPEIIQVLFGDKWLPSIPVFRLMALAVLIRILLRVNGQAIFALGRPDWILGINGAEAVLRLGLFTLAAQYNVVYIAAVHLGTTLVIVPIYVALTNKLIEEDRWSAYFQNFRNPVLGASLMLASLSALKFLLRSNSMDSILELAIAILTGGVSYLGLMFLLDSEFIRESGKFAVNVVHSEWIDFFSSK